MNQLTRAMATTTLAVVLAMTAVGCSDGKPSKEDYRSALTSEQEDGPEGAAAEGQDKYLDCLVDGTYDDLSAETVQAVVDKDEEYDPSKEDEKVLEDAATKCMEDVVSGFEEDMDQMGDDMGTPDEE